jgi:transposase-like protein
MPEARHVAGPVAWNRAMKNAKSLYHGHRFPAAVIGFAVRWYFWFQLSLRDIEESLFERGVIVIVSVRPDESGWRE